MPINPQIPLAVEMPQMNDPIQRMGDIARMRSQQDEARAKRQVIEDQQLTKALMNRNADPQSGVDMKAVREELYRMGRADIVVKLDAEESEARMGKLETGLKELELQDKLYDMANSIAASAEDQGTWDIARTELMRLFPEEPALPVEYDQGVVEQLQQLGLSAKERNDIRKEASTAAKEAMTDRTKSVEALAKWQATAQSQEEWTDGIAKARFLGFPEEVIEYLGFDYSKQAVERAAKTADQPPTDLLDTIKSTSDLGDETRMLVSAFVQEHGRMPEQDDIVLIRSNARANIERARQSTMSTRPESLVKTLNERGEAVWTPQSQAAGRRAAAAPSEGGPGGLTPNQSAELEQWRFEQMDKFANDPEMMAELEATYMRAKNGGKELDAIAEGKAVQSPSGKWIVAPQLRDRISAILIGAEVEPTEENIQTFLSRASNRKGLGVE